MSILIDTNVFLWAAGSHKKLSDGARELLEDPSQPIFFSAASVWEIVIKWSSGRLDLPAAPSEVINSIVSTAGLSQLSVNIKDALAVADLPFHHSDPFDRLLVAQARNNGFRIMTADPVLAKYDVDVIALWLDDDE